MKKQYHYVYLLIDLHPTTSEQFYIGVRSCYCLPSEDNEYMSSSKHVATDRCDKIVLEEFESRKEAIQYEILLHEEKDVAKNKVFYNRAKQTSVGFDTSGTKLSTEQLAKKLSTVSTKEYKAKRSELSKKMWANPKYRQKLVAAHTGKKQSTESINKRKMIGSANPMSMPVVCMDTGVVYESAALAEQDIGLVGVLRVCRGERISVGGYLFRFVGEEHIKQRKNAVSTGVRCVETGATYKSIREAYKKLGYSYSGNISKCLKDSSKKAIGFHWEKIYE